jgi:hypothetical protein
MATTLKGHNDFYTAIFLTPLGCIVGIQRTIFAKTHGGYSPGINGACPEEKFSYRSGAGDG